MLYASGDYGKTWTAIPNTSNWMSDHTQRVKTVLEKAGYSTKFEGHPPELSHEPTPAT